MTVETSEQTPYEIPPSATMLPTILPLVEWKRKRAAAKHASLTPANTPDSFPKQKRVGRDSFPSFMKLVSIELEGARAERIDYAVAATDAVRRIAR